MYVYMYVYMYVHTHTHTGRAHTCWCCCWCWCWCCLRASHATRHVALPTRARGSRGCGVAGMGERGLVCR